MKCFSSPMIIISLALACLWCASPAQALTVGVHRSTLNIQNKNYFNTDEASRLAEAGIFDVRIQFQVCDAYRGGANPTNGNATFDWSHFDRIFSAASGAGIEVLPILMGPATASDNGCTGNIRFPKSKTGQDLFRQFAGQFAYRYGSQMKAGSFFEPFRRDTRLGHPVRAYEIWNEPNNDNFNENPGAKEGAKDYADLLVGASEAIKNQDKDAQIVLAGLSSSEGKSAKDWGTELAKDDRVAKAVDVYSIHPYDEDDAAALKTARQMADDLRDALGKKPVWITEIGFATSGWDGRLKNVKSEPGQAKNLSDLIDAIEKDGSHGFDRLYVYDLRDQRGALNADEMRTNNKACDSPSKAGCVTWANFTGLFRADGSIKPSWGSLSSFGRGSHVTTVPLVAPSLYVWPY